MVPLVVSQPQPRPLVARLKPKSPVVHPADQQVSLEIELENTSNMDLYVLTWQTPLEGLYCDCLKVVREGRDRVEYDGPMVKRGKPTANDYLEIKAGQSVTHTFDLARAYDVHLPGQYEVELDTVAHCVLPQLRAGLAPSLNAKAVTDIDQPLQGGGTRFTVVGTGHGAPKSEPRGGGKAR
jgi:hypothetical protein